MIIYYMKECLQSRNCYGCESTFDVEEMKIESENIVNIGKPCL